MIQKISLLFFFCFATQWVIAQDGYLADFKQKWKNGGDYTLELAESMPADLYDFKPMPEMRSFKEQLLHIMGNMVWLSGSYLGTDKFSKDLKKTDYSKTEVLALLRESLDFAENAVAQMEAHDLRLEAEFFAGPMKLRQILTLMNDHMTHHRGQLIVYLRLKSIKPPSYRGW